MSIGSGQFFYWHKGDEYVCQWANCHIKTWQELLQKITNIISRQGEWRRFFVSPTPDYLLSLKFIIRHNGLILGRWCATNITGTRPIDFLHEMDYIRRVHKEPPFYAKINSIHGSRIRDHRKSDGWLYVLPRWRHTRIRFDRWITSRRKSKRYHDKNNRSICQSLNWHTLCCIRAAEGLYYK